jgi:ssDNA-binding Zn-finger/Zn-ribbon topoisomerase 1
MSITMLKEGEFDSPDSEDDLIEQAAGILDSANAAEICGEVLFFDENETLKVLTVEAIIGKANYDYGHDALTELLEELDPNDPDDHLRMYKIKRWLASHPSEAQDHPPLANFRELSPHETQGLDLVAIECDRCKFNLAFERGYLERLAGVSLACPNCALQLNIPAAQEEGNGTCHVSGGGEVQFDHYVPVGELNDFVKDIVAHPSKYNRGIVDGHENAYYQFLKYLWITMPNGTEVRLYDYHSSLED